MRRGALMEIGGFGKEKNIMVRESTDIQAIPSLSALPVAW